MEMDIPHHDIQHIHKPTSSIIPFGLNRKAIFEGIASASPESHTQIRSSSCQTHNDLTIGVCYPNDKVHLTQIPSGMESVITGGENSCENRTPQVGIPGESSEGTYI